MKIKDSVILVTGAGHGIGRAIVERLAKAGAEVAFTYRNDNKGAEDLVQTLTSDGKKIKAYKVEELADDATCKELLEKVVADFGKLDAFVANAGGAGSTPEEDLNDLNLEQWQKSLNNNLLVAVTPTKYAIKVLQANENGGKILFIGSVLGLDHMGRPGISAYSAAKAGVHNFGKTIAKALAPKIAVNVLAPGRCWSAAYDTQPEEVVRAKIGVNRHGRAIEWDEIAQAAEMILENDSMIGQLISVDAGFSLRDT